MIELFELAGRDEELRFSPFCWRIRMALAHKGVEAETVPWHFGEPGLPDGLRHVPVLVDHGEVIGDSNDIARHLEDKYQNGPSLFGGEGGEIHARFVTAWADTTLHPALVPLMVLKVMAQMKPQAAGYFRQSREARLGMSLEQAGEASDVAIENVRERLAPARRVLTDQPFLGGQEPTYADYAVFGEFQWVRCAGGPELLKPEDPVRAWRERMLDLFEGLAREAKTAAD